ncbi:MAG: hypothetical protein UW39_C0025G0018 [Parcubacteria group bacterium GW2011_GWC2_44_17]|nr:MAG: hypothetical protein UW39_C0025G0018 [Parcubacteria group bacterium GW2011_GWC2_44_17]
MPDHALRGLEPVNIFKIRTEETARAYLPAGRQVSLSNDNP